MSDEIDSIKEKIGIDLKSLPLSIDKNFVSSLRDKISKLGPKKVNVLFISSFHRRNQEKAILFFLSLLKINGCDYCYFPNTDVRFFSKPIDYGLEGITPVSPEELLKKHFEGYYDCIISFDCASLLKKLAKVRSGCKYFFLGKINRIKNEIETPFYKKVEDLAPIKQNKERTEIFVYNFLKNTIKKEKIEDCIGSNFKVKVRSSIDFPSGVDVGYQTPEKLFFDYLLLGGADRDYKWLYCYKELFNGKKVIVTNFDATRLQSNHHNNINLLRDNKNILFIKNLPKNLYLRVLLYSKVILVPVIGRHKTDYTSISDAILYGKPVITTLAQATKHLGDRVFMPTDKKMLKNILKSLEDKEYYAHISKKVLNNAQKNNNIFKILFKLYGDL